MATKKTPTTTKNTSRKKPTPITKKNAITRYLKGKGYKYPSFEDFQVWCLTKKIMTLEETIKGEYKGVLLVYSKRYLTNHITAGTRGAGNFVIMLRALEEEQAKSNISNDDRLAPVKLIIDFNETKKGKHERKRIKHKKHISSSI